MSRNVTLRCGYSYHGKLASGRQGRFSSAVRRKSLGRQARLLCPAPQHDMNQRSLAGKPSLEEHGQKAGEEESGKGSLTCVQLEGRIQSRAPLLSTVPGPP